MLALVCVSVTAFYCTWFRERTTQWQSPFVRDRVCVCVLKGSLFLYLFFFTDSRCHSFSQPLPVISAVVGVSVVFIVRSCRHAVGFVSCVVAYLTPPCASPQLFSLSQRPRAIPLPDVTEVTEVFLFSKYKSGKSTVLSHFTQVQQQEQIPKPSEVKKEK